MRTASEINTIVGQLREAQKKVPALDAAIAVIEHGIDYDGICDRVEREEWDDEQSHYANVALNWMQGEIDTAELTKALID
jgi:hypothetical protein